MNIIKQRMPHSQINLHTNVGSTGNGFSLEYKTTSCSRQLDQPYGQIFR